MNEAEYLMIIKGAQNFSHFVDVDDNTLHFFFVLMDTDQNGLIDTLELLTTVALISGAFLILIPIAILQRISFVHS
jgi:hypothetical protein